MTARSRERGSHAGRPRGNGLPFTVPGLQSLGTLVSVAVVLFGLGAEVELLLGEARPRFRRRPLVPAVTPG